jgi:hypothetical protein
MDLVPHIFVLVLRFLAALSSVHFIPFNFINFSTVRLARSILPKNDNHRKTCSYHKCEIRGKKDGIHFFHPQFHTRVPSNPPILVCNYEVLSLTYIIFC